MKAIHKLSLVILMAGACAFQASAKSQDNRGVSGTITFYGTVVEPTCDLSPPGKMLKMDCPGTVSSPMVSTATNLEKLQFLPYQRGHVSVQWLDDKHQRGIMTVEYI